MTFTINPTEESFPYFMKRTTFIKQLRKKVAQETRQRGLTINLRLTLSELFYDPEILTLGSITKIDSQRYILRFHFDVLSSYIWWREIPLNYLILHEFRHLDTIFPKQVVIPEIPKITYRGKEPIENYTKYFGEAIIDIFKDILVYKITPIKELDEFISTHYFHSLVLYELRKLNNKQAIIDKITNYHNGKAVTFHGELSYFTLYNLLAPYLVITKKNSRMKQIFDAIINPFKYYSKNTETYIDSILKMYSYIYDHGVPTDVTSLLRETYSNLIKLDLEEIDFNITIQGSKDD